MKIIYFLPFFLSLLFTTPLYSQSNINQTLSINTDGSAPNASAQLDVSATDKGMLVPRMTSAQRTAIASPATGLLVYDTNTNSFWFYNGTAWAKISPQTVLADADSDTKIQVEESPDEDVIRFNLAGSERLRLRQNASGSTLVEFPNNGDDVYLGTSAGQFNTTGDNNTAVGKTAMGANTTGSDNVALGAFTLSASSTGAQNTAIGAFALGGNLSASENTAVGYLSQGSNTTGTKNTAVGALSLRSNTTASENTAIGYQALFSTTTGNGNTACGNLAMQDNIDGFDNAAFGHFALANNVSGDNNSAFGKAALFANTDGDENVAFGRSTLGANTTGSFNTAIGRFAMNTNTIGSLNTALGFDAGVASGNLVNVTAIGANAEVSASNCLVLGSINGVNGATSSVNVGIGITNPALRLHIQGGSDATPSGGGYIQTGGTTGNNVAIDENEIMARNNGTTSILFLNNEGGDVKIGNSSSQVGVGRTAVTNNLEVEGTASKTTAGSWAANSDARLKKNITPLDSREMLDKLLSLQGITYEWNDDKTGSTRPEGIQYGFTAQNIREVFPTLVEEDKLGYLQTAYGTYDAMMVEAIRALKMENDELRMENASVKGQLQTLTAQLDKITAALATLSGCFGAGMGVEIR
jgi:hypothetical protein